ncbi:MAG: TnsA endonuclease N-terminal domain-containing protein [Cyclobacteriaceae bacterium]|nr:TnsA endonuclease N-terminal domain-containing protein [Cyclobacteriaceae bacterium]
MKKRKSDKKKLKEKRGEGKRENYVPFDHAIDFASLGGHKRIAGTKIHRTFHFFSDLEKHFFFLFEFADNVTDIREQFPLKPLAETKEIAKSLNIKHPSDEKGNPVIMRTDFRVSFKKGEDIVFTIKPSTNLSQRVIEKFEIDRVFESKRNIKWYILTEKELNPIVLRNIIRIRESYFYQSSHLDKFKKQIKRNFIGSTSSKNQISEIIRQTCSEIRITYGEGRKLFDHLLARKFFTFNLSKPFSLQMTKSEFQIKSL